jgi:lipopolysaccharide transport system permease protein
VSSVGSSTPGPGEPRATGKESLILAGPDAGSLFGFRDLLDYRELFWAFVVRDVKVRYKQTLLGVAWVALQPLAASGILALVFRKLGAFQGDAAETLLYFLGGLAPWMIFANSLNSASSSLERGADLIRKVYFPRIIAPGAHVCTAALDYAIVLVPLVGLALALGRDVTRLLLFAPALLVMQLLFTAGLGFVMSALNAQYHDVKYVVPFALMVGMFLTVFVPLDSWSPGIQVLLSFSPMTIVVEGHRVLLLGGSLDPDAVLRGALSSVAVAAVGAWFFGRRERAWVDIL